jgi:hypothetical protein
LWTLFFLSGAAQDRAQKVEIASFYGYQFGSFWCSLPGGCLVGINAITSIQVDASVGVIFTF